MPETEERKDFSIDKTEFYTNILLNAQFCYSSAVDFCRQAVWKSRGNASAFQGSAASTDGNNTGARMAELCVEKYNHTAAIRTGVAFTGMLDAIPSS